MNHRVLLSALCLGLPPARAANIGVRTAHIATSGMLVGGHLFDVPPERLHLLLLAAIATGVGLVILEAWPSWIWFVQGRGLLTLLKLLLIGLVPLLWSHRVALLVAVIVLGSVGSHMPARWRYYSFLHRRMISYGCGPGTRRNDKDSSAVRENCEASPRD